MVIQGVIRPPPEIRAVADRTALYVAKNGRAFESRILGSAKGRTPKFAFLHETSPFHAYYEDRIQFYENGGEDEKEEKDDEKEAKEADALKKKKKSVEESRKKEKMQKASVIDPVAKALLTQRSKISQLRSAQEDQAKANAEKESEGNEKKRATITIPAPPPIQFLNIVSPSSLTIAQIEMIQLVAQFAALEGKGGPFLHQLTLREWRNTAFGFLQPRHGHFAYFSALVDAYKSVLGLWTGGTSSTDDRVKGMANNVDNCLNVAAYRAEYERDQDEQKRKQDEEGVLSAGAQIDWHEFVVVETIDFPADEAVELSMLPPPPPQNIPSVAAANKEDAGMSESEDEEEDEDEQIRVVPSYTPKVVGQQANSLEMVIDPITGKSVAVKDMPEHMRIQLLDPKWAEERKKFQERQKDSNLVGGDVVASNIARFAQARGDVFGKTVSEARPVKTTYACASQ
jgi:splicing factor 3A subunit 1